MRTIIKSQVAVLITLLTAFALTLTACGGGSSSSAGGSGGSSLNSATVSGTVASNGVASLEIRDSSGLIAAVSDFLVPAAQADDANQVSVTCGDVTKTDDVSNGQFTVQFESSELGSGSQNCTVVVDGVPAEDTIQVVLGSTTTVRIVYDDGQAVVFSSGPTDNGDNSVGIATGDVTSSDDDSIASADDDSDFDSVDSLDDDSEDSTDDDSDSPSDDDSDSQSSV